MPNQLECFKFTCHQQKLCNSDLRILFQRHQHDDDDDDGASNDGDDEIINISGYKVEQKKIQQYRIPHR